MSLFDIIAYVLYGLLMIIGYFLKDKQTKQDAHLDALEVRLDATEKDMFKIRLDAQQTFITRAEFNETITRVFNKLDEIARDIRDLIKDKADKD